MTLSKLILLPYRFEPEHHSYQSLLVQPTGHFFVSETDQILAATAQNHCGVQGWVMSTNQLGSVFPDTRPTTSVITIGFQFL